LNLKYAGYIDRQTSEVAKLAHVEKMQIPAGFDFSTVQGLRNEAKQKLKQVSPRHLGQALQISGVSPADVSILMIALMRYQEPVRESPTSDCCEVLNND
jgi:tRNA uridine 5-carboxymethylaminomethyl modification enzyme